MQRLSWAISNICCLMIQLIAVKILVTYVYTRSMQFRGRLALFGSLPVSVLTKWRFQQEVRRG
jgi:hypothetical protein